MCRGIIDETEEIMARENKKEHKLVVKITNRDNAQLAGEVTSELNFRTRGEETKSTIKRGVKQLISIFFVSTICLGHMDRWLS